MESGERTEPLWAVPRLLALWAVALAPALTAITFNPLSGFYVYALPKRRVLLVLVGLAAAAWLVDAIRRRGERRGGLMPLTLGISLAVYTGAVSLAGLFSPYRWLTVWGWPGRYEGVVPTLAYLGLFALTFDIATQLRSELLARWSRALLLATTLVGMYALAQFFGWDPFFASSAPTRPHSTLGNPVWMAALTAASVPLAIALFCAGRGLADATLGFAALTSSYLGLLTSFTRSAWLALAVGLSVLILRRERWMPAVSGLRVITVAAIIVVLTILFFFPGGAFVRPEMSALHRVDPTSIPEDASARERVYVWRRTFQAFLTRPLLGWGPDALRLRVEGSDAEARSAYPTLASDSAIYVDRAHNELLQVLSTTGLLGLAAYLGLLVSALTLMLRVRSIPERAALEAGILGGLAVLITAVQFQPTSLAVSTMLWSMLGLGAGLAAGEPLPSGSVLSAGRIR